MRRCEDEKMYSKPPLLEEPFAQTLSGNKRISGRDSRETVQEIDSWHEPKRPHAFRSFRLFDFSTMRGL
jgi:hypothetical protein